MDLNSTYSGNSSNNNNNRIMNILSSFLQHIERNENEIGRASCRERV
jgi:hypothetical protein